MKNLLGERLRMIRKNNLKLTQNQLGKILGIKGNVLGRIEAGDVKIDHEKLDILITKYKINLNWLVSGIGFYEITPEVTEANDGELSQAGEPQAEYNSAQVRDKETIRNLRSELDLYKKLYEKQEVEIEYLRSQLPKK